jgi:hypothetical protein
MVFWPALGLLAQSASLRKAVEQLPSFGDCPATGDFHGHAAPPILRTAGQRLFRTRIREAARNGPNFAGHYSIAEWGCGTSCVSIAVIDAETGAVYEGPFGSLPKAILFYGLALRYDRDASGAYQHEGLVYHVNSRLLVARGCPNDLNCGAYFYEWTGSEFKLLRKIPANPETQ